MRDAVPLLDVCSPVPLAGLLESVVIGKSFNVQISGPVLEALARVTQLRGPNNDAVSLSMNTSSRYDSSLEEANDNDARQKLAKKCSTGQRETGVGYWPGRQERTTT